MSSHFITYSYITCTGGTRNITIGIPAFSVPGRTYGFAVEFTNPFSSIKYDIDAGNFSYDTIRLLDPMPAGSGEWLELPVVKWDANFVSNLRNAIPISKVRDQGII